MIVLNNADLVVMLLVVLVVVSVFHLALFVAFLIYFNSDEYYSKRNSVRKNNEK